MVQIYHSVDSTVVRTSLWQRCTKSVRNGGIWVCQNHIFCCFWAMPLLWVLYWQLLSVICLWQST